MLACPPAVEASIYRDLKAAGANIYPEVAQIQQPVVVMRAGTERKPGVFDLAASPTASDLASRFAHGRDIVLPEASHFIPMEQPERVAEEIAKLRRYFCSNSAARRIRSPLNTTREIRSVAATSCSGLPSTSSRLASIPCRIAPMCSAAPSSLAALTVAA